MEYSIDNVGYFDKLDKVMMEMAVDIVICPFPSYQLFNYCSRLIDKKVFFHVHNVPSKLMYPSSAKLPNILKESFVDRCLKRIRFDLRYLASFRRIELNKMKIVLLSDFFRDDLKVFMISTLNVYVLCPIHSVLMKNINWIIRRKRK